MGKLDAKVAIVTGGGSGIGKAIAHSLVLEGCNVVIAGRGKKRLTDAAAQMQNSGPKVVPVPTDVTNEDQVIEMFRRTMELFGRVDILVNNAGLVQGGPLDELPAEVWDRVIATNLRGPFLCTREAMRVMKRQGSGRIINIGSISAQRPRMNSGPYSVSKFGIWGLTIVTALEGREFGISASCLHPGNVRIEDHPYEGPVPASEPKMKVDEIAEAAVFMASLPPHVNMLEAIVLPVKQAYLARG
jgi:NAD(P)-dependent dehydrogenase (short-subunit alcohol dehydrogenase family)